MVELPRGTVSLLFTDVEGSTQLQHRLQDQYREVVTEHRRLLEEAIESNGGRVVDRQTESFFAVFTRMRDAAGAASDAQRAIAAHQWPDGAPVKVRMGIHAGEPELDGDRYVGLAVARAARIGACAYGGQVLLSSAACGLLSDGRFPVRPLGSYPLKDFDSPEPLFQLQVDGLPDRFPRPRTGAKPGRSRRRWVTLAAAAIGLVVAAVLAAALLIGAGEGGSSEVHPNNVGVIDPQTNRVIAEVPVGLRPGPVAFGEGSIWVGNTEDRNMTRIDAASRSNAGTIALDNQTPTGIAYGKAEGLWVAHGVGGKLSRVDPQFGQITSTLDVAGPSDQGSVTIGGGFVWAVFGDSTIARVDPAAPRLAGTGFAGASPAAAAVAGDQLWVANSNGQSVQVFALQTFDQGPVDTVPVGRAPSALAFGANAVWVANAGDDTVVRIDPTSSDPTDTIDVGDAPVAIAASAEAVWVANRGGTVSRIDPSKREVVETIETGNAPAGIAVGGDGVWVSVQAP
jgi:YVTN family beta-propeller protein